MHQRRLTVFRDHQFSIFYTVQLIKIKETELLNSET